MGGTYRDIILHRDGRISFRQQLLLDLSDIAKGFAVDKAAEFLVEAGVAQATINAGGNLRFIGDLPDVVALRDPRAPRERVIEAKVTALRWPLPPPILPTTVITPAKSATSSIPGRASPCAPTSVCRFSPAVAWMLMP